MTLKGVPVPPGSVSTMAAADIEADLARQLDRDGYLLLRGVHDPDAVEAARLEILHRLAEVGEVKEPVEKGLASGTSSRREKYPTTQDLGSFGVP